MNPYMFHYNQNLDSGMQKVIFVCQCRQHIFTKDNTHVNKMQKLGLKKPENIETN